MKQGNNKYSNYDGEKQGELFAEFRTQQAGRTPYFKKRGMLPGKKFTLSLSCENVVLISIILIMLFVIFFSLGVERGKMITSDNSSGPVINLENKEAKEKEVEKKPPPLPPLPLKPYTIQVVAFKKEKNAKRKAERLKGEGYDAFVIPSDRWAQVCIGKYINKEASMSDFNALKKKYPKCYFRKIND